MNKLFVWKNAWLYNNQGVLMAIAEDAEEGMNLILNYLEEIQFANRKVITKLIAPVIPQTIDYGCGFVLWEDEIQTNNSHQEKVDKLYSWRSGFSYDDNGTFLAYANNEEEAGLLVQKVMIDKYLFLPDQAKETFTTLTINRKLVIYTDKIGLAFWRGNPWE